MSIPVYVPQPQKGGTTVAWPDYVDRDDYTFGLPHGFLRQRGGGTSLGRRASALLHRVRPKLEAVGTSVAKAGAKSLSSVAQDVMQGKDLKEALTDEATAAKIDLKRKIEESAHKTLGTVASLQGAPAPKKSRKTPATSRGVLNTLFDD